MKKISDTNLILNADGSVYHLGLLPEQIAEKIIAVGDPGRVEQVSQHFDSIEFRKQNREFVTHTGMFAGNRLTVMSTGIGPDNIDIFFNELDALVNIDLKTRELKPGKRSLQVIRLGTSGALQKSIPLGAHLVSDYAVGLDNLMNFYELTMDEVESSIAGDVQAAAQLQAMPYVVRGSSALREKVGYDMVCGNTVTSPGFYGPQGRQVRLFIRYPQLVNQLSAFRSGDFSLTNFEMETAAYFAFGRLLGHEVTSVNAIIANRITEEFSPNPGEVIGSLIKKVLERI